MALRSNHNIITVNCETSHSDQSFILAIDPISTYIVRMTQYGDDYGLNNYSLPLPPPAAVAGVAMAPLHSKVNPDDNGLFPLILSEHKEDNEAIKWCLNGESYSIYMPLL